jgi:uncharacterized protein (TIGR03435 family)
MRHLPPLSVLICFAAASVLPAQEFEAASIKRHLVGVPGVNGIQPRDGGHQVVLYSAPLAGLINVAYRILFQQQMGGPDWMYRDLWDLNAVAGKPSSAAELRVMMQNLLAKRFHLTLEHATRSADVYPMTVDKDGFKGIPSDQAAPLLRGQPMDPNKPRAHTLAYSGFSMVDLADRLTAQLRVQVFDKTGLAGSYDFLIHYEFDIPRQDEIPTPGGADASLIQAFRKDVGLRLERTKGTIDVIKVVHAQMPDAN